MPLTIFVAPFRWYKAKGQEYEYYGMIEEALNLWTRASGGKVSFQIVQNLYDSQINIEWKRVERESLGHCYFNYDNEGRLFSAEVHIGLSDGLLHQEYQDKNEVMHTIVHEMGHALGILHSPFKEDIMYVPHQYGVTSISERDRNTLKWLYKFPNGATSEEILTHYKLTSNYNLDHLIYMLETDKSPDEGIQQNPAANTSSNAAPTEEQLKEQQNTLAKFNKFNLSLQNFSVSSDVQDYFRKLRVKKDFYDK